SVASFFISRIDTLIDNLLTEESEHAGADQERQLLESRLGKVAIANGKLTYERYKQIYSGSRWNALKAKNAQTQRLLWASTSTKNPSYRDVVYVEELIGPETVDTIPPATFDGFRDHGVPKESLEANLEAARQTMQDWEQGKKMRRLWGRDSSLWTNSDESNWLGWLAVTEDQLAHIGHLTAIAEEVQQAGFTHVGLLGMGGSSLAPEVISMTFGR